MFEGSRSSSTTRTLSAKSGLRPGDVVELDIEKAVYRGQGLGRHEGQVVFVPRAVPGDRVRVRIEAVTSGYVRGRIEQVVGPASSRRAAPCPLFDRCGGCAYQSYDYAGQLALKEAVLRETLTRGRVEWAAPIVVHSSPEVGWRTRASLHVHYAADGLRLGLHEEGSHRVTDLDACLQLSPAMNGAQRALAAALARRPDWARHVRDVDLAEAPDGGQLVASIETDLEPPAAAALGRLADEVPALTGLGVMAGTGRAQRFMPLRGEPWIDATVQGLRLRAHVRSFFQGNRFLLDDLVAAVTGLTPAGGSVLDLYAGVGLFALPLAGRAERVRGIEIDAGAVGDAERNIEHAGLGNVRVERGDVAAALRGMEAGAEERVVLDPPRAGAGPEVVRAIAQRNPLSIVYVSCDPATLARDLRLFAVEGYVPSAVELFDLFPDTFHLETVVALRKA
jgi:23S rRNA (uracil1939-C5)-methyltransferase